MAVRQDLLLDKDAFVSRYSRIGTQSGAEEQPETLVGNIQSKQKYAPGIIGGGAKLADKFLGGLSNAVIGATKNVGRKILGASSLFERYVVDPITGDKSPTSAEQIAQMLPEGTLESQGLGQSIGSGIAEVAQFAMPSAGAAKLAGTAGRAVSGTGTLAKLGSGLAKWGTMATGEAGLSALSTALDEGEINKNVGTSAIIGGAIPLALPVIGKGIKTAGKVFKFGLGSAAKLAPETIDAIVKNPEMFTKEAMENITKANLTERIAQNVKGLVDDLGDAGKSYSNIRKAAQGTVNLTDDYFDDFLTRNKIIKNVDETGNIVLSANKNTIPVSNAELKKLESILNKYRGDLDADAFLNARAELSGLSHFDAGKSGFGDNMFKEARKELNLLRDNFTYKGKGISHYDDVFSAKKKDLKPFLDKIFDREGNLKDSAYSVIGNLDKEAKSSVLAGLKKVMPEVDFEKELRILRAVQDIAYAGKNKVGEYAADIMRGGGAIAAITTGNPVFAAALLARPSLIIPVLRMYGKIAGVANGVITKISQKLFGGETLTQAEKNIVKKAMTMGNKLPKGQADELLKLGSGNKPLQLGSGSRKLLSEPAKQLPNAMVPQGTMAASDIARPLKKTSISKLKK